MSGYTLRAGIEIGGVLYLRAADLARRLEVTSRQLDAWIARRDRNGFPEPPLLTYFSGGQGMRTGRLWDPEDVQAVVDWRNNYVPQRGGAPCGPANGAWKNGSRCRIGSDGARVRTA